MIERSTATPAQYAPWRVPPQRAIEGGASIVELKTPRDVAEATKNGLALIGNKFVYAIGANAREPDVQKKVKDVKKDRDLQQPLGLTVPFDDPILEDAFDLTHMGNNVALCETLQADKLTGILGALAFVRVPVNLDKVNLDGTDDSKLPLCVISQPDLNSPNESLRQPTVQPWSPAGNESTSAIIKAMSDSNILPVMTSANESGQREITTTAEALEFARAKKLPICIDMPDSKRKRNPLGSYAALVVTQRGFEVVRTGGLAPELLMALLGDLLVSRAMPEHSYPDNVLRLEHLPLKARYARGADMRNFILEKVFGDHS